MVEQDSYIRFRISNSEKKALKEKAKKLDLSLSEYIRQAVLCKKFVSKTDLMTVYELRKIGNNINQIAKYINTKKTYESAIKYAEIIEKNLSNMNEVISNIV